MNHELNLDLQDTEWPFQYTDHDRMIVRAICFDDAGFYYFVRAERDDDFGKATLIETSGRVLRFPSYQHTYRGSTGRSCHHYIGDRQVDYTYWEQRMVFGWWIMYNE